MSDTFRTQDDVVRAFKQIEERQKQADARFEQLEEKSRALEAGQRKLAEDRAALAASAEARMSDSEADVVRAYAFEQDNAPSRRRACAMADNSRTGVVLVSHMDDDGTERPGLLDDPSPRSTWQREMQQLMADRKLLRTISPSSRALDDRIRAHVRGAPPVIRPALERAFADASGVGAEWVPDVEMAELGRTLHTIPGSLFSLFPAMNMPAGGDIKFPWLTRGLRPYIASRISADDPNRYTSSDPTTTQRSVTATKLAARVQYDPDASDDSIVAALPELNMMIVEAIRDAIDDAIMNGDTAGTHQDTIAAWNTRGRWGTSGLGGSADHRKAFLGLRALAFDKSKAADASSINTYDGFRSMVAGLDSALYQGDVVALCSPEDMLINIMGWDEYQGLDKVGSLSTLVNGALGMAAGVSLIQTSWMTADQNTSGVFDNATTTKTSRIVVNRSRFRFATRRALQVETARDVARGINDIVSTWRGLFFEYAPSALTEGNVYLHYNLPKA